ncbi:MAG: hypothetical protein M1818_007723 [Claussenomyces sp. TS43310]|nr:MAG: hypothetical protein M1818_007723 [Claussenomyces sp. TS43310]
MPTTTNRTNWPLLGGAIALQPGWFQGHATAFFYINLGFGTDGPTGGPPNMSNPMVPVFQITGPSKGPYPGGFCLPQVPLPANTTVKVGDNATIQVVEVAIHGASLYSCVDITFAEPEDVAEVNSSNCANSSDIGFNNVYSVVNVLAPDLNTTSGAVSSQLFESRMTPYATLLPLMAALIWAMV